MTSRRLIRTALALGGGVPCSSPQPRRPSTSATSSNASPSSSGPCPAPAPSTGSASGSTSLPLRPPGSAQLPTTGYTYGPSFRPGFGPGPDRPVERRAGPDRRHPARDEGHHSLRLVPGEVLLPLRLPARRRAVGRMGFQLRHLRVDLHRPRPGWGLGPARTGRHQPCPGAAGSAHTAVLGCRSPGASRGTAGRSPRSTSPSIPPFGYRGADTPLATMTADPASRPASARPTSRWSRTGCTSAWASPPSPPGRPPSPRPRSSCPPTSTPTTRRRRSSIGWRRGRSRSTVSASGCTWPRYRRRRPASCPRPGTSTGRRSFPPPGRRTTRSASASSGCRPTSRAPSPASTSAATPSSSR